MSTEVRDNPGECRHVLLVDEWLAGLTQYRLDGARSTMGHTEVGPAYELRGLGDQLAQAPVDGEID